MRPYLSQDMRNTAPSRFQGAQSCLELLLAVGTASGGNI